MVHRIVRPEAGELISASVSTPFLLTGDAGTLSSTSLHLAAGQFPGGALSVLLSFGGTEYGRDMTSAVQSAILAINARWGLNGDWRPGESDFTGARCAPFRKKDIP